MIIGRITTKDGINVFVRDDGTEWNGKPEIIVRTLRSLFFRDLYTPADGHPYRTMLIQGAQFLKNSGKRNVRIKLRALKKQVGDLPF